MFFLLSCITRSTIQCSTSAECYQYLGTGYVCSDNVDAYAEQYCLRPTVENHPERISKAIESCKVLNYDGTQIALNDWSSLSSHHLLGHLYEMDVNDNLPVEEFTRIIDQIIYNSGNIRTLDRPFSVIHCPFSIDENDTVHPTLKENFDFLVKELHIPLVIGPYFSNSVNDALQYNNQHLNEGFTPTTFISPTASEVGLSNGNYLWRTISDDSIQAPVLAHIIKEKIQLESIEAFVAVIQDSDVYSDNLYERVMINIGGLSLNTNIKISNEDFDNIDWQNIWSEYEASQVAILFISSSSEDYHKFLKYVLLDESKRDAHIFFSEIALIEEYAQQALESVENLGYEGSNPSIHVTAPYIDPDNTIYQNFITSFSTESMFSPFVYDATWLALYGYRWGYRNTVFPNDSAYYFAASEKINEGLTSFNSSVETTTFLNNSDWEPLPLCPNDDCAKGFLLNGATGLLDFVKSDEGEYQLWRNIEVRQFIYDAGFKEQQTAICSSSAQVDVSCTPTE